MESCPDIILLGPMGAGKSSLAAYLSARLQLPVCALDNHREAYYQRNGADFETGFRIEHEQGYRALYDYCRPYRLAMTAQVLEDFRGHIFDFGAEDSIGETPDELQRLQELLAGYPNVFFLLPSEDISTCMFAMVGKPEVNLNRVELNRHFLEQSSNRVLGKHRIVREERTIEDVGEEIVGLLAA